MKSTKVAGRYAQSLLELAEERQVTDQVTKDMEELVAVVAENRELAAFFDNPIIKSDKKVQTLDLIFPKFDDLTKAFVKLITNKRRESFLPLIAEQFGAKVKASKGIIPVSLTSAAPLDAEVKEKILAQMQQQTTGTFELTERVDESLIGGFVFRMGDMRIEASVARQLNELKQRLTR
jgi:F-type H+-transporting ATPase subunit delta